MEVRLFELRFGVVVEAGQTNAHRLVFGFVKSEDLIDYASREHMDCK